MSARDVAVVELVEGPTSDVTFHVRAPTLESLFAAASEALLTATVADPAQVGACEHREIALEEPDLELLLLRFLNELVWLRDAKGLLLRAKSLRVSEDGAARLAGTLSGEPLSRGRHALTGEVKAATAHGLCVRARRDGGFEARFTLDV